jgi:nitroreductase
LELVEAIKSRKSIRGYEPTPVPKETLGKVLEIATHAPSAMNVQPWKFTILGGKVLDELKEALQEKFLAGVEPHPDFGPYPRFTGVYKSRQVELGKSLFQLMDIAREDKGKRLEWGAKMIRFFDAPNAIIISVDKEVSDFLSIFSLGTISQTIALAAIEFGLGTCIEQDPVFYPEVIRQIAGIPESQKIAVGIAIGYPDWDFPANKLESAREPVENIATWRGV